MWCICVVEDDESTLGKGDDDDKGIVLTKCKEHEIIKWY